LDIKIFNHYPDRRVQEGISIVRPRI